jgi:putative aminopeptidase FrvX
MIDLEFLKTITEIPSVATACYPVLRHFESKLAGQFNSMIVPDGFCLVHKKGTDPAGIRTVFVSHVDEIGGIVTGSPAPGLYSTEFWGNAAAVFTGGPLVGYDYLSQDAFEKFPLTPELARDGAMERIMLRGAHCRPFRTAWTFGTETRFQDGWITAKALDPRATAYAVMEAARALDDGRIGIIFVLAEECSILPAQKAVDFIRKSMPSLSTVINADVPDIANLEGEETDLPSIRLIEKGTPIDPYFALSMAEDLKGENIRFGFSTSRSASQTRHFTPVARTISVALPCQGTHRAEGKMRLGLIEACIELLGLIAVKSLQ